MNNLQPFNGVAPDEIVYVPVGTHIVCAEISDKPKRAVVTPTESLAAKLNQDLQDSINESLAGNMSRPFVDFQHDHGRAAALPVEFYWDADRGVVLKLEWTPAGRAAVEGKEFSYFSPEVAFDSKTNQILGLIKPGAVGGLVNIPAFQKIPRLAAQHSTIPNMDQLLKLLIAQGFLPADATEVTPESIGALGERLAQNSTEMECAKAKCADAETKVNALQKNVDTMAAQLAKINDDAAESFVAEQLKAGRITEESKPIWFARAKSDLKEAQTLLASFKAPVSSAPNHVSLRAEHKPGELPKTISKAEFDKWDGGTKMAFSSAGGRIV